MALFPSADSVLLLKENLKKKGSTKSFSHITFPPPRNYGGVYVGLPADLTTVAASQSKSTRKGEQRSRWTAAGASQNVSDARPATFLRASVFFFLFFFFCFTFFFAECEKENEKNK